MKYRSVLAIACVLLPLFALSTVAADAVDLDALREERHEKLDRYFVRQLTQKRLSAAEKAIEAGEHDAAREDLEKLNPARLNPRELAEVYRLLGYAAHGQGDAEGALDYFQKAVDEQGLEIDAESSLRYSIVELHASLENWEEVDEALAEWFKYVEEPNGVAYYLLAISRYQRQMYDEALPPALEALATSDEPQERWLQLVSALYLQREDFDSAVPILEELVTRFGKKQYWNQLSLIYGASGDYRDALEIQQLAYAQGLLQTDEELRRLARSYLFHELPYPAARVLERGLADGYIERDGEVLELLGNAWIAAREYEKSIGPLEEAASLAEDGRLYLRLGQVLVQRESWTEATELLQKALDKGGLVDNGKALMLLGISYYSDDRPESARTAFQHAREYESTRSQATAWLKHIERERQDG